MRLRDKAGVLAAVLIPAAALGIALSTGPGHAIGNIGHNWCIGNGNDCVNAWSGGPWVKDYTGGPSDNGLFAAVQDYRGSANYLLFGNFSSPWASHCIGDAYNDPNRADASLDACPGANGNQSDSGDGWGTHMVPYVAPYCSSGYTAWYDLHWGGWLGPADLTTNGAQYYLNKGTPYCFKSR